MCGICGFIGLGSTRDLQGMARSVAHRGPDAEGIWTERDVFLAHRRLSIIDLAGGAQPMATEDGELVIVFNGEIYNHQELRAELQALGCAFATTHSDTEVLLHGFRRWGRDLPNRLNGMWAFAIYDRRAKTLFCCRDRFGKKPFFYTLQNGTFAFASELAALKQHPGVTASLSKLALQKYFAYGFIPAPHSLYQGIHKLPGGHSLWVNGETLEVRIEKYWDFVLEPTSEIPRNPEAEWGEQLRHLLDRAVQRRLMSDVPLGIFLSGGIDSSAITAFASRHVPKGSLKTFSIGFEEATFDESAYAKQVAELFHTDHRCEQLSLSRAHELLEEIAARLDEPLGDSSLLPTALLSRFTRRHVTVALGGDGGDELFAGYDPFRALRRAEWYSKLVPRPIHRAIRLLFERLPVSHGNMSLDFKIKRTLRGLGYPARLWVPAWMGPLDSREIEDLFCEPIDMEELYSEAIEQWDACSQANLVDKTLQYYTKLYLQDDILVKVDRASMMHGLEVRAPFLDIELVDFVRRIPNEYKFRNGTTKYLLKKALEPVLPNNILFRAKKGFGSPIGAWFKDGTLPVGEARSPMLSPAFVRQRVASHKTGKSDERAFLWNLHLLNSVS